MNPKIITVTLLIIVSSFIGFTQDIILSGQIINTNNNQSIPFATIEIRSPLDGIGVAADQTGVFELAIPERLINDTLLISSLGYNIKELPLSQLDVNQFLLITLLPKAYSLSEVKIFPKPIVTSEFGILKRTPEMEGGLLTKELTQMAVFIENKDSLMGRIKSVSYYVKRRSGKPRTPFRVRLYDVDYGTGGPGNDLLTESLVVHPKQKGGWIEVNLLKYNLEIPENGVFVAMEWIRTKKKYEYKTIIRGNIIELYGQVLGHSIAYDKQTTWYNHYGKGWFKPEYRFESDITKRNSNALIKLKLEVFE